YVVLMLYMLTQGQTTRRGRRSVDCAPCVGVLGSSATAHVSVSVRISEEDSATLRYAMGIKQGRQSTATIMVEGVSFCVTIVVLSVNTGISMNIHLTLPGINARGFLVQRRSLPHEY